MTFNCIYSKTHIYSHFRLAYLHLAQTDSKSGGQGHANFHCKFLGKDDRANIIYVIKMASNWLFIYISVSNISKQIHVFISLFVILYTAFPLLMIKDGMAKILLCVCISHSYRHRLDAVVQRMNDEWIALSVATLHRVCIQCYKTFTQSIHRTFHKCKKKL